MFLDQNESLSAVLAGVIGMDGRGITAERLTIGDEAFETIPVVVVHGKEQPESGGARGLSVRFASSIRPRFGMPVGRRLDGFGKCVEASAEIPGPSA